MEVAIILNRLPRCLNRTFVYIYLHIFLFFSRRSPEKKVPPPPPSVCLLLLFGYYYHHFSCVLSLQSIPPPFQKGGTTTTPVSTGYFFGYSSVGSWLENQLFFCCYLVVVVQKFLYTGTFIYDKKRTRSSKLEYRVTKPPGITSLLVFFSGLVCVIIVHSVCISLSLLLGS